VLSTLACSELGELGEIDQSSSSSYQDDECSSPVHRLKRSRFHRKEVPNKGRKLDTKRSPMNQVDDHDDNDDEDDDHDDHDDDNDDEGRTAVNENSGNVPKRNYRSTSPHSADENDSPSSHEHIASNT
jgi:hypothetical protein